MRTTQPVAAAGLSLALQAAWSATSTTAMIRASFAKEPNFFNSLLVSKSDAGYPIWNTAFGATVPTPVLVMQSYCWSPS